jgi:hypothetical protein
MKIAGYTLRIVIGVVLFYARTLPAQSPRLRGITTVSLTIEAMAPNNKLDSTAIRRAVENQLRSVGIALARTGLDSIHGAKMAIAIDLAYDPTTDRQHPTAEWTINVDVIRLARLVGDDVPQPLIAWVALRRFGTLAPTSNPATELLDRVEAAVRSFLYAYRTDNGMVQPSPQPNYQR